MGCFKFPSTLYSDPRGHQRFIPCDFAARGFGLRPKMYEPTTNHFSPLTQGKNLWYPEYLHRPSPQHFCSTVTTTTTITFSQFSRTTTFFVTINLSRRRGRWCHPVLMRYLWSHRRKCIRVQIYEIPAQKESNRLAPYYCHWNEYSYRFQWLTRIPLAAKNPCAALSIF